MNIAVLKQHLNLDGDQDDELLAHYLAAATTWCKAYAAQADEDGADFKQAVLMAAAHFYENREAVTLAGSATAMPLGVQDLLTPLRAWTF
jgi:uncharacterized phage protein (predicted DNA packaging)